MAVALFIKSKDLVDKTSISGGLDPAKFRQCIEYAQDFHIEPLLGTKLYDKIGSDIVSNSLSGAYVSLVDDFIKPVLINYAMVEYLPFASVTIANGGVYKHNSETSDVASDESVAMLVNKHREYANTYADRLIKHLCENYQTDYLEYKTNVDDDIKPIGTVSYTNWNLK